MTLSPAALTADAPGLYRLEHHPDGCELWLIGDENGVPVDEPELVDVAVPSPPVMAGRTVSEI